MNTQEEAVLIKAHTSLLPQLGHSPNFWFFSSIHTTCREGGRQQEKEKWSNIRGPWCHFDVSGRH